MRRNADTHDSFGPLRRLLAAVANAIAAAWRWATAVIEVAPEGSYLWEASDLGPMQWRAGEPETVASPEAARLGWAFRTRADMAESTAELEMYDGSDTRHHIVRTGPIAYRAVGRAAVKPRPAVSLAKPVQLRKRLDRLGMPLRQRRASLSASTLGIFAQASEAVRAVGAWRQAAMA